MRRALQSRFGGGSKGVLGLVGGGGTPSTPRVLKESWCLHRGGFGPPPHNLSATRMVPGCLKFPTSGALHQKLLFFLPPKSCILGHFFWGGGCWWFSGRSNCFFLPRHCFGGEGGMVPSPRTGHRGQGFFVQGPPVAQRASQRSVCESKTGWTEQPDVDGRWMCLHASQDPVSPSTPSLH